MRCALAEASRRFCRSWKMVERFDIADTEADEIRKFQGARSRDVPQRVTANVAVIRCVRQLAYSHAIEDDPNNAFEVRHI
jgi:hypothetical protein